MGVADVFLAQHVTHADAQMQRVLEAVQNRLDVFRPVQQVLEHRVEPGQGRQFVQDQRIHQLVDHARIAGQDARQVRVAAHSRTYSWSDGG